MNGVNGMNAVMMRNCSHKTNECAIALVRTCRADMLSHFSHNASMIRRGTDNRYVAWYLREWMAHVGMTGRGAQTKMMKRTSWSKATMSQLWNDDQDFSPKILREAADALEIAPFELLLRPADALALRGLREQAEKVVAISRDIPLRPELRKQA